MIKGRLPIEVRCRKCDYVTRTLKKVGTVYWCTGCKCPQPITKKDVVGRAR